MKSGTVIKAESEIAQALHISHNVEYMCEDAERY